MDTLKKLVLVDDHVVVRSGLRALIEKVGPYHVVAEYDNGREFVAALPLPEADLIIMDISMPEMDGEEALAIIKEQGVAIPVLILTLNQDEDRIIRLFRKGVRGCLQKNCTAAVLKEALEAILNTGFYYNEWLTLALQSEAVPAKKSPQQHILDQLSAREKEFLKLICHEEEYTYDQIADKMGVQPRTVDGYRESIFEKFGIRSKTGLVLFLLRNKVFDLLD